jgi:hypothetical protein
MTLRCSLSVVLGSLLSIGAFGIAGSLAACSSDDPAPVDPQPVVPPVPDAPDAGPPAVEPDAAPPKTVPKPTFPEVKTRGGPVIKAPKVVPIVFPGDPLASKITELTAKLGKSAYWKEVGSEYGVGPITPGETVTLTETAPAAITSAEIETWLQGKLSGATPELGAPDVNTLYAVYYPATTKITMDGAGELGQSCEGYGGYHFEIAVGGTHVGYTVLPRCSDIDELTVAASHEYFEWATDPFPESKPAFNKLDDAHWAWQATMIGELGDLCTFLDRDNLRPADVGYVVQRQWSNKASLAGKYPCAPAKNAPYLQAITFAADDAVVPDYGTKSSYINTKAVRVAPGATRKVDVLVYSDQPGTQQVPLRAMSYNEFYGGKDAEDSGYVYKLEQSYGTVGSTVTLDVKAPVDTAYDILIMLAYTSQTSAHYWPVLVVNDDAAQVGVDRPTITPATLPKRPKRGASGASGASGATKARPFTTLGTGRSPRPLR